MRVMMVMALAAAMVACGGAAQSTSGAGGTGGGGAQGGSGGSGLPSGGSGGSGGMPAIDPADRFNGECLVPSVPTSTTQVDPLPVQFQFSLDAMGLTCAGYLLEPDLGSANLIVFARTLPGVSWTAELGTDPRKTDPIHCYVSRGGQACTAVFGADDLWRTIKIRLAKDGACVGTLRQDLKVSDRGAVGSHQALDSTDCP